MLDAVALHKGSLSIMDVGMEVHLIPPGMENTDVPDIRTKILAV